MRQKFAVSLEKLNSNQKDELNKEYNQNHYVQPIHLKPLDADAKNYEQQ